ncbi:MAG TPA: 16S rRNA (cytidine(1402)-2'-O)-methyltransferase [Anaerolineaceae bacterium]
MGTLYLVATPIGNLEDISLRGLRILKEAALIAAEDTRQTQKLLNHYHIQTKCISYHEHNKLSRLDEVLAHLALGDIALVSDAGMPGLNDPGYELVEAAIRAGYEVSPVPGASAPIAALVVSGLPTDSFLYLGYLPRRKQDRCELLEKVKPNPYTLIFLETPHRLLDALEDIENVLGNRRIAVARELTKLYEEIFRGNIQDARVYFTENSPKGEFTLVIEGMRTDSLTWDETRLDMEIQKGVKAGVPASELARSIAQKSHLSRRVVYQQIIKFLSISGNQS